MLLRPGARPAAGPAAAGLLDARVHGGPRNADGGTPTFLVGGPRATLDRSVERFVLPGRFDPEATGRIVRTDMELAERMASDAAVPLLSGGVSHAYRYAERVGPADLDTAALIELFEFDWPDRPASVGPTRRPRSVLRLGRRALRG